MYSTLFSGAKDLEVNKARILLTL